MRHLFAGSVVLLALFFSTFPGGLAQAASPKCITIHRTVQQGAIENWQGTMCPDGTITGESTDAIEHLHPKRGSRVCLLE
jgi:hypothetical protein